MDNFLEGIARLRHWYNNPNEKSNKYKPYLLSLNRVLPSSKRSIKAPTKCKTSVYVLMEICLQWSKRLCPKANRLILCLCSLWSYEKNSKKKQQVFCTNWTDFLKACYLPIKRKTSKIFIVFLGPICMHKEKEVCTLYCESFWIKKVKKWMIFLWQTTQTRYMLRGNSLFQSLFEIFWNFYSLKKSFAKKISKI